MDREGIIAKHLSQLPQFSTIPRAKVTAPVFHAQKQDKVYQAIPLSAHSCEWGN